MTAITTRDIYPTTKDLQPGDDVHLETSTHDYKHPLTVESVDAVEFQNPQSGDWTAVTLVLEGSGGGEHHIHGVEDHTPLRDNGVHKINDVTPVRERPSLDRFEETTPCVFPLDDLEPPSDPAPEFTDYTNTPGDDDVELPDGVTTRELTETARQSEVRSLADLANALGLPHTTKNTLRVAAVKLDLYDTSLDRPEANTTSDEYGPGVVDK